MTELRKARVTGEMVGWTIPVLGPDGEQVERPISGSGSPLRHKVWSHRMARRGELVELPAADYERLTEAGVVEPVVDPHSPEAEHLSRFDATGVPPDALSSLLAAAHANVKPSTSNAPKAATRRQAARKRASRTKGS
jgi:hypothetical protein